MPKHIGAGPAILQAVKAEFDFGPMLHNNEIDSGITIMEPETEKERVKCG